jgi:plasmid stability protein
MDSEGDHNWPDNTLDKVRHISGSQRRRYQPGASTIGQVLIRNIDDVVLAALRERGASRGLSLEAELREVLTRTAGYPRTDLAAEFAAVRAMTPDKPHRLAEDLVRESREER